MHCTGDCPWSLEVCRVSAIIYRNVNFVRDTSVTIEKRESFTRGKPVVIVE